MNDKDNIILFPTNRIKNKDNVKKPVDEKQHKLLVEQQTKELWKAMLMILLILY